MMYFWNSENIIVLVPICVGYHLESIMGIKLRTAIVIDHRVYLQVYKYCSDALREDSMKINL